LAVIETGARDTIDVIRQREDRIEDESKITDRGREVNIWKLRTKGGSINLGKLGASTKPDVLGLVLV